MQPIMSPMCGREKDLKDSEKMLLGLPHTPPPPAAPAPAAPKRAEQPPTPPLGPPLTQVPQGIRSRASAHMHLVYIIAQGARSIRQASAAARRLFALEDRAACLLACSTGQHQLHLKF